MSNKLALVRPMILPPQAEKDARSLMSNDDVNKLKKAKFIQSMPQQERELLLTEMRGAYTARMLEGVSGLALGAHLTNIQEISKKYRIFDKCLRLIGGINARTARRYMDGFKNASVLPAPVVKAMMLKGMTITPTPGKPLGKYTQAVRYLAPPKTDDPERVTKYVRQIEEHVKETRSRVKKAQLKKGNSDAAIVGDPVLLLETAFRNSSAAANKLPNGPKVRRKFLESLVGMLMTYLGIQSAQQFAPEAIPPDFIPKRGRPTRPTLVDKEKEEKKETPQGAA